MTRFLRTNLLCAVCCLLIPATAHGQGPSSADLPDAPSAQQGTARVSTDEAARALPETGQGSQDGAAAPQISSSADQLKQEEKQRLLGIMPAFNTVQSGVAAPLRPVQKFDLWYHSAVDPFTFGIAAIDGGIEQAEDTYPEYGEGVAGFAKRFGASYADSVDGNFWGNAVLPSLLHQDPRYFRLGHGSPKRRLGYAVLSTVRCKGDNGRWQPSYSNIGGNLIGGALSNLYYPAADRGAALTLERGFTVTAEGAIGALAFEFYPDLIQFLKQRRQRANTTAGASAAPTSPSAAGAPATAKD